MNQMGPKPTTMPFGMIMSQPLLQTHQDSPRGLSQLSHTEADTFHKFAPIFDIGIQVFEMQLEGSIGKDQIVQRT